MKTVILALSLLLPLPAIAQTDDAQAPTLEDSLNQLRDGAGALLELFMQEMEPAVQDIEPLLDRLSEMVANLPGYYPPEVLPNGDILLRRKPVAEAPEDQEDPAPPSPPEPEAPLEL
ncbi:hypothetical protein SAMN04488238_103184 [Roseicitreum antarcticum]|uniref:AAA+ family ATPase n=2 Tax=Roseicitreum antarcticum TaxID=564137 RepID=A0A1H2VWA6_9RHOB|nr:hypothetical protein SAMN04488238_103184 [Roseicitreum antarcticum]